MWNRAYASGLRFGGYADIEWILQYLKPEMKVLEIGCGTGKSYLALRREGVCLDGIDSSEVAIARLREEAERLSICVNVKVGDARQLEFADESYDGVIAIHLLDTLCEEAREQVLEEVARVLKKSGIFFCQVFCVEDFRFGSGRKIDDYTFERGGISTTYFTLERLSSLLGKYFIPRIWHVGKRRRYGYRCVLRSISYKKTSHAP